MRVIAIRTLQHSRGQFTLAGESLEVSDAEAPRLIEGGYAAAAPEQAVTQQAGDSDFSQLSAADLIVVIAAATLDQINLIDAQERLRSRPRATVIAAIESRLAELLEQQGESDDAGTTGEDDVSSDETGDEEQAS